MAYIAPNRSSITTCQDQATSMKLRAISAEIGISQQELIAEGLDCVLTKVWEAQRGAVRELTTHTHKVGTGVGTGQAGTRQDTAGLGVTG
jgi:hypothetical protein